MAKCLQPIRIVNPYYTSLAKTQGCASHVFQLEKDYHINVPCGVCLNCLSSKSSEWRLRLLSEWHSLSPLAQKNTLFLTFTLSDDYVSDAKENPSNYIRRFCENYRQYFGKSPRRWFITEYGEKTGRFHFHGLLFDSLTCNKTLLSSFWSEDVPPRPTKRNHRLGLLKKWYNSTHKTFGFIKIKRLGNIPVTYNSSPARVIGYITKYVTKYVDKLLIPNDEKQRVFVSPGLGIGYCHDPANIAYARQVKDGRFTFNLSSQGFSLPYVLPRYYRQKIFKKEELEAMKWHFIKLNEEEKFTPPFRVGSAVYNDIYSYARFLRSQGLKCDLDFQYLSYMYNKKF